MNTAPPPEFDHRDVGTPARAWAATLEALPSTPLPPPDVPVFVLAAHPDDETLGAGALLAAAAEQGNPVTLLLASLGEASHPRSPTHTPAMLRAARAEEVVAALRELAPAAELRRLDLPDGALAEHTDAIRDAVVGLLPSGPAWVVAPWEGDRHPDHAACSRAARRAVGDRADVTLWEYPVWAWHWATPGAGDLPEATLHRLDVPTPAARRRTAALACYPSQTRALSDRDGDEPILSAAFLAHFDRPFDVLLDPRGIATDPRYFDALYAESADPWGLGEHWYERRKRALLLASLPRPRFGRAFEPGCSGGLLTAQLAARCDELVAADSSQRAVDLCRQRLGSRDGISVERMVVPGQWPPGRFDLLVLSEVGYYVDDLSQLADRVGSSLRRQGVVVACHWRHPVLEHRHPAAAVHDALSRVPGVHRLAHHVEADFLLDVFTRSEASVAQQEGLVP